MSHFTKHLNATSSQTHVSFVLTPPSFMSSGPTMPIPEAAGTRKFNVGDHVRRFKGTPFPPYLGRTEFPERVGQDGVVKVFEPQSEWQS